MTGKQRQEQIGLKPINTRARNETRGVACEMMLKALLLNRGFIISDPVLSCSYDFITEYEGILNTVQVRSATHKNGMGYYRIRAGAKVGGYSVLLVHVIPMKVTYVIPWNDLKGIWVSIHERRPSKYEKNRENWELLKAVY